MRRRSLGVPLAAVALTMALVSPQSAQSAPTAPRDARAEREAVRAEKARVAAEIDTSKASLTEIDDALTVLEENVATQEAELVKAQEDVAEAKQDIADAEAAIEKLDVKIETLRDETRKRAVASFVSPPGDDVLTVLESKDFTTASSRKFYIELRSATDDDVADKLDGALSDVAHQRDLAAEAKVAATTAEAQEQAELTEVTEAKDAQQAVADSIEATIDEKLAQSVSLAATDRALSKQIAEEQAALVARLVAQQAKQKADEEAAAEAAAAAAAAVPVAQKPSGGEVSAPPAPSTPRPSTPAPSGPAGTGTGGISLCTAGGFTVNCIIKDQVASMVAAAAADSVYLGGGAYRDPAQQIELRKKHCGTSYYAIYQASASSCSPPTARPGSSQHEVGLAIDFSNCSRSSACFGWLSGNAASFGFYNLPSESWHWSTSGS